MSFTIEQLSAAFKKNDTGEVRTSNYYRFWDMKENEHAVVRFLIDSDPTNPLGFMVEKLQHVLEINGDRKAVPCLKMYDEDCPICKVSSQYYKEEGKDSVNGRKYWRKKQHILQALIIKDPLPADSETGETSEGKVRFLNLGFQLYSVIKEAFDSGDLDVPPFFHEGGCDFIIKKSTTPDGRAKYDIGSKFARKASDLTPDQIGVADEFSIELNTLIPSHPGIEKVEAMLEASLTGGEYNAPSGAPTEGAEKKEPAASTSTPVAVDSGSTEEVAEFDDESSDILAKLRARKSKSAN